MGETKSKSSARRTKKMAATPEPSGPIGGSFMEGSTCGHSLCGPSCSVRYVGPTTHIRDHHIVHAARGVAHVWTAAIVAGLAVVLTGAIAYSAIEARASQGSDSSLDSVMTELKALRSRVDGMDAMVRELRAR